MKTSAFVAIFAITMLAASGTALADDATTTVVKTDGGQTVYHRDMRQPLTGVRSAGQQAVDKVSDSVKETADKAKNAFTTTTDRTKDAVATTANNATDSVTTTAGETKDTVSATAENANHTTRHWHRRARGWHRHHRGSMKHQKFHHSSAETDALNKRSLEKARALNGALIQNH